MQPSVGLWRGIVDKPSLPALIVHIVERTAQLIKVKLLSIITSWTEKVSSEKFKNFESFFKCSQQNHQTIWWNRFSWEKEEPSSASLTANYQHLRLEPTRILLRVQVADTSSHQVKLSESKFMVELLWAVVFHGDDLKVLLFGRPHNYSSVICRWWCSVRFSRLWLSACTGRKLWSGWQWESAPPSLRILRHCETAILNFWQRQNFVLSYICPICEPALQST